MALCRRHARGTCGAPPDRAPVPVRDPHALLIFCAPGSGSFAMTNREFDLQGVNHLALVCKDMARTVDFYTTVLGMPLIKTIELPNGMGQHFFFDLGNGDSLAFFWFPDAPKAQPGIASATKGPLPGPSAHGSMNQVATNGPGDAIDEYYEKLKSKGIACSRVISHDDSPMQASLETTPSTFVR